MTTSDERRRHAWPGVFAHWLRPVLEAANQLFIALALLALLVVGGCASRTDSPPSVPTLAGNAWVTSDDGKLALRLSVLTPRVGANEHIHVAAQLRNVSQQNLTVLRPFGDWFTARSISMKIWDGERPIPYTGSWVSYVVGSMAFAVIGPGEVVEDKLELGIGQFAGIKPPGRYTLRYDYSYGGHWDQTAAAGNSGISNAWRGTISSREVGVFRE